MSIVNKQASLCWVALFFFVSCISGRRDLIPGDSIEAENHATHSSGEHPADTATSVKKLARERFGSRVQYIPNEANTYVLCVGKPLATRGKIFKPSRTIRFFVYHFETETIVFEDAVDATSVSWEDDSHVKVTITPGTLQSVEIQEYGYRYDVISGTKESLSSPGAP
jgi:hypothetical protein